jgi:carbamoyltransferase
MAALLGISGARRNACAAICVGGSIRAVCEQERLTRVRGVGLAPPWVPSEAVNEVLTLASCHRDQVSSYVVAERQVRPPAALPRVAFEHHQAHAATAYFTSPFRRAAVIVCDRHRGRELTVWRGDGGRLTDQEWRWRGRAFASLYAACAAVFGLCPGQESRLEALAHVGNGGGAERLRRVFRYVDGTLRAAPDWRTEIRRLIDAERYRGHPAPFDAAAAVQRRIGELLLEFIADVGAATDADHLCLGGGLFYNTYFTTLIRSSRLFDHVFVPINPGNPGLAVGATLMLSGGDAADGSARGISPFLGPEYDAGEVKATLDGCKLSYAFVSESEALDQTIDALHRGLLVGWFDGRMEWGHRALGHRSILASPHSPYLLDNLNCYLRKRERWRSFGISVGADRADTLFRHPVPSPFMEYEQQPCDDRLRHVMPPGATAIRVQTVGPELGRFYQLHTRIEQATGVAALVNTSFNGFHEPIACTPRDAIRVFYGTGLDVLVMGRFILRK